MRILAIFGICAFLTGCNDARPLDNTDNHSTGERSGFIVKIDHGTGCEYLVSNFANGTGAQVVPRFSEDGRTVKGCRKPYT